MEKPRKPRADSKLKNLPAETQEDIWTMLHPTDPDSPAMTLEAVAVALQVSYGVSVSVSTLADWRSWYALERRMLQARERANQTALELARNPDMRPEDIDRVAQTVFTAEMLQAGNVKGYVAVAQLGLARKTIEQNEAKLQQNEARLEISRKALEHDERRVALLEAKAAEAKAKLEALTTAAKSLGGLTPETLAAIEEAANLL